MGGGPRTFPGGVSKWQWKRMQAKKAKQLLKARLLRERQIYEIRKRAELKAAVYELEKPWELVEKAPTLLSVSADEQLKVLADRFQKPGGFDMWSDRDGPQVFRRNDDGSILPSRRFFPKGVVHSVKPYGLVGNEERGENDDNDVGFDDWIARGGGGARRRMGKDYSQGVRWNADEKKGDDSGPIDVEARVQGWSHYINLHNADERHCSMRRTRIDPVVFGLSSAAATSLLQLTKEDPRLCYSQYGYCGSTSAYCGVFCRSGPCYKPSNNGFVMGNVITQNFFDGISSGRLRLAAPAEVSTLGRCSSMPQ